MADDSWFRNSTWNADIATRFDDKLRRARRKEQYLRIQAGYLTRSHPNIALELLDRFFKLPDQWDQAQAHVDRAEALVTLGHIDKAITSYEAALAREADFPNLKTQAYLALPTLIVERALAHHYDRAMAVLKAHSDRPLFPSDHFQWHSAYALILASRNQNAAAREHAQLALKAASQQHSGFTYHSKVWLIGDRHKAMLQRLSPLCDA